MQKARTLTQRQLRQRHQQCDRHDEQRGFQISHQPHRSRLSSVQHDLQRRHQPRHQVRILVLHQHDRQRLAHPFGIGHAGRDAGAAEQHRSPGKMADVRPPRRKPGFDPLADQPHRLVPVRLEFALRHSSGQAIACHPDGITMPARSESSARDRSRGKASAAAARRRRAGHDARWRSQYNQTYKAT